MKTKITTLTFALAFTGLVPAQAQQVPQPKSADDVAGTPPGTVMTKEYVEMVGRLAYIWGWPLVNQINRRAAFSQVPEPGRLADVLPVAPPGQIAMLTDYIKPEQTFVTCPNQDTVYGAGFQKLDTMPVVVQVPDFAIVSSLTRLSIIALIRSLPLANNMAPNPASICSLGRTGRAMCRRESMPSFVRQRISAPFSRESFRTTCPKTKSPFSPCSIKSWFIH